METLFKVQIIGILKEAKGAKRGLWADSNPVPPWEFRRGGKGSSKKSGKQQDKAVTGYWLNTSSGTRHNSNCRYCENTKKGETCSKK